MAARGSYGFRGAMALLALVASLMPVAPAVAQVDPEVPSDGWIVTLKPQDKASLVSHRLARGAGVKRRHVFRHVTQGFSFSGPVGAAASIRNDPRVKSVVRDLPVRMMAETTPRGVRRIDARHPSATDAHERGFTGTGVRIAILDSGVDLDHPDLRVDTSLGKICVSSSTLDDGNGHGTHVAGTAAAKGDNGIGVVGVAHGATIVPVKVLSSTGAGSYSTVMCGLDHLTALATDANPANDVKIANLSLGGSGGAGTCTDGSMRQAVCRARAAGIVITVASGNNGGNAGLQAPPRFPEVVTVSALADYDGEPGGAAGCPKYCDDSIPSFSNYGSVVDVIAPGVSILSTRRGGSYEYRVGTSMAAPHVAGVAALIRQTNPGASADDVQAALMSTGECPNRSTNAGGGDCAGQGSWRGDRDSSPEPLVNALNAISGGGAGNQIPSVSWVSPSSNATVSGTVPISISSSDADGPIVDVQWRVGSGSWRPAALNPTSGRYESSWNTTDTADGSRTLEARATDTASASSNDFQAVRVANTSGGAIFTERFEGEVTAWGASGLWYLANNSACAAPGYASATHAVHYGRSSTCTYATGARTFGTLTSPSISGVPSSATLTFAHYRHVESSTRGYDRTRVQVSYGDGAWQTVWYRDSKTASERAWRTVSIPISPTSSSMKVRFYFDSIDSASNGFPGWLVDDVTVVPR
ncbi:MAG TPA: S8 family serine peptidase [Actinomycetota bacterium]|nr:S8 family serine peptidase [Actinomycetota bacterium]